MPKYQPEKWNKNPFIQSTHNCYSYFLNKIDPKIVNKCHNIVEYTQNNNSNKIDTSKICSRLKPQPGYYAGYTKIIDKKEYNCLEIEQRLLADNPNIKKTEKEDSCPYNFYKGALVLDRNLVYHFYRQDDNGLWSHKDGHLPATNVDSSGQLIVDPNDADRNYGIDKRYNYKNLNYTDFCSYYCIPENNYLPTNMLDLIVPKYKKYDLVIIGAGISGLYCATQLQKKFSKILIIEKSNRIGGRIYTRKINISDQQYIFEEGANRFSKYHSKLMKLIKDLDLNKFLVSDVDELTKEYISSKLFNYNNNINFKDLFKIVLDFSQKISKNDLKNIIFKELCIKILGKSKYKQLYTLWSEYISLARVNYDGGNNAKFRIHPTYNDLYCNNNFKKYKTITRKTPYLLDYINLFNVDSFTSIRMINTLFFNKDLNTYYRLSIGNIEICKKLLYTFFNNGGEITYNTKFLDFDHKGNTNYIKLEGRLSNIISKHLIITLSTKAVLTIPKLLHLKEYLNYSISSRLALIHAIYPKDPKTNRYWFDKIPWIITDNLLRHIMPINKKKGIILISYLAGTSKVDNVEKLYQSSPAKCYKHLEKYLKQLFPTIDIPKPIHFSFKPWSEGTHAWKRNTDYCSIYKKIIYPIPGKSVYLSNEAYSYRGGWVEGSLEIADEIIDKIVQ